jgi:tRNA C32,U32 (ribose-2'-O)-methylase TrmJ
MQGLTPIALEMSDAFVKIPMYGFTESFNISVSAALSLYHLTEKLRRSDIHWHLKRMTCWRSGFPGPGRLLKTLTLLKVVF